MWLFGVSGLVVMVVVVMGWSTESSCTHIDPFIAIYTKRDDPLAAKPFCKLLAPVLKYTSTLIHFTIHKKKKSYKGTRFKTTGLLHGWLSLSSFRANQINNWRSWDLMSKNKTVLVVALQHWGYWALYIKRNHKVFLT